MYPQELIEEIRMQNDIVDVISQYVQLKPRGSSYFGLCPFHHEKTPSFSVNRDKQFYYCFGCGAKGNVYGFVMQIEGCDFVEATKRLADRAHIALPEPQMSAQAKEEEKLRRRLYDLHKSAARFYYDMLQSEAGAPGRAYLEKRKMTIPIQRKFGMGYAPPGRTLLYEHLKGAGFTTREMRESGLVLADKQGGGYHDRFYERVMFPIIDVQSRIIGFGGRLLEKGEPKYLNSPETAIFSKRKHLFGLNFAKDAKKKELILVEGYMDMISIYQAGFHNVVASLGTAFHPDHVKAMKKYVQDVIILYDSDEAGTNAALRAIPILVKGGMRVRVTQVPDGKDPDEFIQANGPQEFAKLLVNAVHHIAFRIGCLKRNYTDLNDPEQKVSFTREAAQALSELESDIERDVYTAQVAKMTGVEEEAIRREVEAIQGKRTQAVLLQGKRTQEVSQLPKEEKGLLEAQRDLLAVCAANLTVYEALKKCMQPEEFTNETYRRAFYLMQELWEKNGRVFEAELISYFHTVEEQALATDIFAAQIPKENPADLEKAINDEVGLLKKTRLDKLIAEVTEVEALQKYIQERERLKNLHIRV